MLIKKVLRWFWIVEVHNVTRLLRDLQLAALELQNSIVVVTWKNQMLSLYYMKRFPY